MKVVPVLVAFHTVDWIRIAVTSYLESFPEDRLLVVDNNPRPGEPGWRLECDRERLWLAAHPGVDFIENRARPDLCDGRRTHGSGIDAALAWCRRQGADVLVHFEPDCLITGRRWRDNLLAAIEAGAWMAGTHRKSYGAIHPTASAWLIPEIRASFRQQLRNDDVSHERFAALVNLERLRSESEPGGYWPWCRAHWDTGEKAWFEAALHDRAVLVEGDGLFHYWLGSTGNRLSEPQLIAKYPELAAWFARAPLEAPPRRVEHCRYRTAVRRQGDAEAATCGLLRELTSTFDAQLCSVERSACEACVRSFVPSPGHLNAVVASRLFQLCETIIERGGAPGCDVASAERLLAWAERNLDVELPASEAAPAMPEVRTGQCGYLGEEVGCRVVNAATGHSRLPVYHCAHPAHRETTLAECQVCRDWTLVPGTPPTPLETILPPPAHRAGPRIERWAVGITTAPRARPTLAGCLDHLARAGWPEPRLFVDISTTIPSRFAHLPITLHETKLGAWANYYLTLAEMALRDPAADAYLLVQDDALFHDRHNLREYLEQIAWPAEPLAALSLYCPSKYTRSKAGWSAITEPWQWGALAFVFPRESARRFLADRAVIDHCGDPATGHAHIDDVIGAWASRIGWPIYFPTPSLVQHTGDVSTIWPEARAVGLRRASAFAGDHPALAARTEPGSSLHPRSTD